VGMTITEKILARHAGLDFVKPGDLIEAEVDVVLANDVTAPIAIKQFEESGVGKVFDPEKIVLVPDHFTPAKDRKSANQARILKDFAAKYNITNYFEVGQMGIEHVLLPEKGIVKPGQLIIGADSHTCTYGAIGAFSTGVGSTDVAAAYITGKCWFKVPESIKFVYKGKLKQWVTGKDIILFTIGDIGVDGALYKAMEFTGEVIDNLPIDERFTMCNMAIEAGGKSGIIASDDPGLQSDSDANYSEIKEYDLSDLEPLVACPHLPSNVKKATELSDIKLDQVVIGSCTNGRLSDLRIAAQILKEKQVAPGIRLLIFPGTQKIYLEAVKEGIAEIFVRAGGIFSTPTCGPCLGGHMGVLAPGEKAIATTNRNFVGRMGDPSSEVYLSNPAVAAASAITGKITHPDEVVK